MPDEREQKDEVSQSAPEPDLPLPVPDPSEVPEAVASMRGQLEMGGIDLPNEATPQEVVRAWRRRFMFGLG